MLRKGNPLPFLEKVIVSGHLWKKFLGGKIQERFYLKDGDRSTNTNNRKKSLNKIKVMELGYMRRMSLRKELLKLITVCCLIWEIRDLAFMGCCSEP